MNDTILVRAAVATDADAITAFNIALARESEARTLDATTVRAGVVALLADPARGRYFIADADRRIVGQTMVTAEWSDWRNGWFWWIQSVYVTPEYRRTGVYRRLHAFIRAAALQAGDVRGLRLYVEHENRGAQQTYARLGMRRTSYQLFEEDWTAELATRK
ncbi:MAG: hypothetical protein CHACPFDD_02899 [Phycisphaerae bacterium]|nr:hypothetical protein [Phycisphaerae bacterium]